MMLSEGMNPSRTDDGPISYHALGYFAPPETQPRWVPLLQFLPRRTLYRLSRFRARGTTYPEQEPSGGGPQPFIIRCEMQEPYTASPGIISGDGGEPIA